MLRAYGFRTSAAAYLLAAILLASAALYFSSGHRGDPGLPASPRSLPAGYYSYKSRLLASEFGLAGFKNKIEKRLESGSLPSRPFGMKDADALLHTCAELEPLLVEMAGSQDFQPSRPQIAAARTAARELVFEASKLKSFIKGYGPDSGRVLSQLPAVEGSIDRLQTHIEGLAR